MDPVTVARDTLYAEVWEKPLWTLAKKYGISDVALGKICAKLNVPTPPRGYWARVREGYRVTVPMLPDLGKNGVSNVRVTPRRIPSTTFEPAKKLAPELFGRTLHLVAREARKLALRTTQEDQKNGRGWRFLAVSCRELAEY
jgi:hypothetical protein